MPRTWLRLFSIAWLALVAIVCVPSVAWASVAVCKKAVDTHEKEYDRSQHDQRQVAVCQAGVHLRGLRAPRNHPVPASRPWPFGSALGAAARGYELIAPRVPSLAAAAPSSCRQHSRLMVFLI